MMQHQHQEKPSHQNAHRPRPFVHFPRKSLFGKLRPQVNTFGQPQSSGFPQGTPHSGIQSQPIAQGQGSQAIGQPQSPQQAFLQQSAPAPIQDQSSIFGLSQPASISQVPLSSFAQHQPPTSQGSTLFSQTQESASLLQTPNTNPLTQNTIVQQQQPLVPSSHVSAVQSPQISQFAHTPAPTPLPQSLSANFGQRLPQTQSVQDSRAQQQRPPMPFIPHRPNPANSGLQNHPSVGQISAQQHPLSTQTDPSGQRTQPSAGTLLSAVGHNAIAPQSPAPAFSAVTRLSPSVGGTFFQKTFDQSQSVFNTIIGGTNPANSQQLKIAETSILNSSPQQVMSHMQHNMPHMQHSMPHMSHDMPQMQHAMPHHSTSQASHNQHNNMHGSMMHHMKQQDHLGSQFIGTPAPTLQTHGFTTPQSHFIMTTMGPDMTNKEGPTAKIRSRFPNFQARVRLSGGANSGPGSGTPAPTAATTSRPARTRARQRIRVRQRARQRNTKLMKNIRPKKKPTTLGIKTSGGASVAMADAQQSSSVSHSTKMPFTHFNQQGPSFSFSVGRGQSTSVQKAVEQVRKRAGTID